MEFINIFGLRANGAIKVSKLTLIALSLSVMASCSTVPKTQSTDESASNPDQENVAGTETEIIEPRVITPNPYLESVPRISDSVRATFDRGTTAMQAENWSEAELIFQELSLTEPRLSGSWVNLGIIYYQQDEWEKAASAWEKAIEINPLNFDAYNHLAIFKREQGEFSAAEEIYLNSLAKWPDNPETHCNLGILYDLYIGDWNQALFEYQECEALTEEPSRQLRGWIVDMERRIKASN